MRKWLVITLMMLLCLALTACSNGGTRYTVNNNGSNQDAASGQGNNDLDLDHYDPTVEEDDPSDQEEVIYLPTVQPSDPPATNIPIISGQYSGATPVVIDPIDKPTPTPVPPLSFSYTTYTADALGLTFEAPTGWTVSRPNTNQYVLTNPDGTKDYRAMIDIRAIATVQDYTLTNVEQEINNMLNSLKNDTSVASFSPSKTAERAGLLLGTRGVYATYTGVMTDGAPFAGRVAAVYRNKVLYTMHVTYPRAYMTTYKEQVYDKLRDTLKFVTATPAE